MANEDLRGLVPRDQEGQHLQRQTSIAVNPPSPKTENIHGPFVDFQSLQEILRFQKQVHELRQDILIERVRLREDRSALSESRKSASDAAAKFATAVRTAQEGGRFANEAELAELYEDVLRTRDAYGQAETEYNQQEARYYDAEHTFNSKEWRLSKVEDELFSLLQDAKTYEPARAHSTSSPTERPREDPVVVVRPETEETALLDEYRSQLGRAEMLEERLGDLSLEQTERLEEQRERKAMSLAIDPSNQDFLDQFRDLYDQTYEELQAVIQRMQMLRQKLISAGFDPDTRKQGTEDLDPPYPMTPMLATPRPRSPAKSDSAVTRLLEEFTVARRRIGEWILSNLSTSPIERARHKAALENESLDNDEWWRLVKEFWNRDAMAKVDLRTDLKSICRAESYSFHQSTWSVEPDLPSSNSGVDATLRAMLEGLKARPETAASESTKSSSTHPSTQLTGTTNATNATNVSFSSTMSSESLPREARIQFDDERLNSVKTMWDRPDSSIERKMGQDLNLQEALPFWNSLSKIENWNENAVSLPVASILLDGGASN